MNQYAVLCECNGCGKREIWYMNTEASDKAVLEEEVARNIAMLINADYNCSDCGASGMDMLAIKEVNEIAGYEDYLDS